MPSFVPRQEPTSKREQLSQREMELVTAIRKKISEKKLLKYIEKYRLAQLAMLKAKIHFLAEQQFQKKQTNLKAEKLEKEITEWTEKSTNDILSELKKNYINI